MTVEIVSHENILAKARALVDAARTRVWITAPWVTASAAHVLLNGIAEIGVPGSPTTWRFVSA